MTENYLEPPVVVATYKLYLGFAPLLYRFPKLYRYSLGQTMEQHILGILEGVFEANALPRPLRELPVIKAHTHCELLKLLIRLAVELHILDNTQYFQCTAQLQEIGKMLGGWINYIRSGPAQKHHPIPAPEVR